MVVGWVTVEEVVEWGVAAWAEGVLNLGVTAIAAMAGEGVAGDSGPNMILWKANSFWGALIHRQQRKP